MSERTVAAPLPRRVRAAVDSEDVLATVAGLALALALIPIGFAGTLRVWGIVVVLLMCVLVVARHKSAEGLAAELVVVGVWLVSGVDEVSLWTGLLAILLLINHGALAMIGTAPPGAPFERAVLRRWVAQGLVVAGLTLVVLGAAALATHLNLAGSVAFVAVGLTLFAGMILVLRHDALAGNEAVDPPAKPRPAAGREGSYWS